MKHGRWTILGIAVVAVLGAVVAGCGGSSSSSSSKVSDLPASSCPSAAVKGPDGKADYLIASDLPLQGASRPQTEHADAGQPHQRRLCAVHLGTAGNGALSLFAADNAVLTQPFNQLAPVKRADVPGPSYVLA